MTEYTKREAEIIGRAKRMYRERIVPELGDALNGQWIVMDANTGDYEIDEDVVVAVESMRKRMPDCERVFVHDGEFIPGHLGGLGQVLWQTLSKESQDSVPHDGSLNLDHYLYGYPKRDKYPWKD